MRIEPRKIAVMETTRNRMPRSRKPHVIWTLAVFIPAGAILLAASLTTLPDGQCSGIGFGCSLAGPDLAVLMAYVVVPPAVAIWIIGHVIILMVQNRQIGR